MAATNPRIVYASISGFGTAPEGAALPGYDLIVQAISGLMSLTGYPDGEPYRAGISVFDVMAGLHATIGILAAVNRGTRPAAASTSRSTCSASALSGLVNQSSAYVAGGVVPMRMGNSHPSLFPYEPLPCSDGDLIITAGNNGQFRKLVEVLGVPELADDPRFARNEDRTANREALRPLLVERLRTRTQGWSGSTTSSPPASRAGRSTPSTAASRSPRRSGLDPVVRVGEGDGGGAVGAQPDPVLRDPARLRPATPGARRARRGDPGVARRLTRVVSRRSLALDSSTTDDHRSRHDRRAQLPHLPGHLRRRTRSGCSARTSPPT